MSDRLSKLKEHYGLALKEYLAGMGEAPLQLAYELGREAIANGMGVLDMEALYQELLLPVLSSLDTPKESVKIIEMVSSFFRESLAPFELTHRSFQEANTELRKLTASLEQQVAERTEELTERTQRLEALHRLTNTVLSSLNLEEVAQNIASDLDSMLGTSFIIIMLLSEEKRNLTTLAFVSHPPVSPKRFPSITLEEKSTVAGVLTSGQPLIIEDTWAAKISPDARKLFKRIGINTRSIIYLPLSIREESIGMLGLGWPDQRKFMPEDIDFFKLLANEVAIGINNARIYEAERNIADTLQTALLTIPPSIEGVEYGYLYRSATEATKVGGDFYDLFELEHDRVGIVVGDVAGKGLEAASLTSLARNTIRAYAYQETSPAAIMAMVNDAVIKASRLGSFITVFFGIVDMKSGNLTYCSAGHPPAMIKRAFEVSLLEVHSPIIGAFRGLKFEEAEAILKEGDVLVLYTDGITEARCDGGFFGEERLIEAIKKLKSRSVRDVPQAIFDETMICSKGKISDDIALLSLSLGAMR